MKRAQQVLKVLALIFVSASLVLAVPPSARAQDNQAGQDSQGDYSNVRIVRLSFIEGDVQYQQGDADWQTAPINLPLQEKFRLATGNGRAEIEFESGLIVRLADNSELDFTQLALLNGGRITQLTLVQGTIIATANPRTNDALSIIAPNIQVGITRGARFRVDTAQGDSWVTTIKGEVSVTSSSGNSRVNSGRMLHISGANPEQVNLDQSVDLDDFDRWAADRDQTLTLENSQVLQSLGASASDYSDYNYGLAELSTYGSFVSMPGYGLCWSPFGISAGWLPFWNGAMVFFPASGWTWVSYEPWGWLPFHTGNWFFVAGRGWFWQFGHFRGWNPAPVRWVRTGGQVGWTPRGAWNPNGGPGGPWIVTGSGGRPGEIRPGAQFHGRPQEIVVATPPTAPTPTARGHQPGPGVPGSPAVGAPTAPFNGPVQGPIRQDPKTRTFVNDNPPMKPVRTAPTTGPRQFVGGPSARVVGPGGSSDNPPNQPTIVVSPGVKTAPTTVQTPPTPASTTVQTPPQPAQQPMQQQPRYTPPPQQQQPQQAAPRYTPPPQPQQQQQQQRSSPPPSPPPPVQRSSPPPSPPPAPVQHTSPPPPPPPPHSDSGGGGAKSSPPPSSSSSSSSTPVHHR
jgi:hypothetical protein